MGINNADLGFTLQKRICEKFSLEPNNFAKGQFEKGYKDEYVSFCDKTIQKIFNKINHNPIRCVTFNMINSYDSIRTPHNFILDNGATLSIRTIKTSDKIAPRIVGQCGIETFNEQFEDIINRKIFFKEEIKEVVYNDIDKLLPVFIDNFITSDYVVIINYSDPENIIILHNTDFFDIDMKRENFIFTKDLSNWNESTTLKYKGMSLAEIQIHKNRTFKFRFIIKSLLKLLFEHNLTTETFGITAEKTICDLFELEYPSNFLKRYSNLLEQELTPLFNDAFFELPKPIKHTGSMSGERGKNSKCSYDFLLEDNLKLSLKTNTGKMVCPPEVGQPCSETCYNYFKEYIEEDYINAEIFKKMVLAKIDEIFPKYVQYLFDSDYLLWVFEEENRFKYDIFKKDYGSNIKWNKDKFSFTKSSIESWNESNTLKYDNITIGEFQVHKKRDCYKFRFNLENFKNIVDNLNNNHLN